jgi:dipeptidase
VGAQRYPLWVKPHEKLTLENVISLIRDHYEGTPFDMTVGLDAGSFGSPNRLRPLSWYDADSVKYSWERPISNTNTAFSYIGQMRAWLPDNFGGICWFGVDDTYFSCYVPIFVGNSSIPKPFTIGDINKYSRESMWWAFNFVSNFANLRYSFMIKDIQKVQSSLEKAMIAQTDSLTVVLGNIPENERSEITTVFSNQWGEKVLRDWVDLGDHLITKYNDGYIKDDNGAIKEAGYPDTWKEEIIHIYPNKFKIPVWNKDKYQ